MYSFVVYLYVNGSGSITSVGEERANLSAVVYLLLCGFCLERFPFPLGMGYVILLWHSLSIPYNYFESVILIWPRLSDPNRDNITISDIEHFYMPDFESILTRIKKSHFNL